MHRGLEATDDAQVDADVVSIPSRTSATVTKVNFVENQRVKVGDVLAELDPSPAQARLAQAEANLESASAQTDAADADAREAETNARTNKSAAQASFTGAASAATTTREQIVERRGSGARLYEGAPRAGCGRRNREAFSKRLAETGAIATATLDQDQTAFDAADATLAQTTAHLASLRSSTNEAVSRLEEAHAKVQQTTDVDTFIAQAHARARAAHAQLAALTAARDLAALDVSYTWIVAPSDGYVPRKKTIEVGQMVSVGQPIVQLVPEQPWVTGNPKETCSSRT